MSGDDTLQLRTMLADPAMCGVYAVPDDTNVDYLEAARALDFADVGVDFAGCTGKDDALARMAAALQFPDWFGGNWDALADSLADLSWLAAPGYVLLLEHIAAWRAADPIGFETLSDILDEASVRWARDRIPFWALLPTRDAPRAGT